MFSRSVGLVAWNKRLFTNVSDVRCSDRYRVEEASDSLERMKPEDVYDSIRRTTADIRHYVKMESNTASPPSPRTPASVSHRREVSGGSGAAGGYRLPVVRSPDQRVQQRYNHVRYAGHVYL